MVVRGRVTLKDVAKVAGVSVPTVSKVLNGRGRASQETRSRILAAAERLDFRPSALGVSLASGRSLTVGVLAKNAPGLFAMRALTGVTTELGKRNLATLIYDAASQGSVLTQHVRSLEARSIDALVMVGDGTEQKLRSVTAGFHVPVVYVFAESIDPADCSIIPDSRLVGWLAADHLLSLGRRRPAHISAANDPGADERLAGFRDRLADSGVRMAPQAVLQGDWSGAWGARATGLLLERGLPFDALFCGNDAIALGASWTLREHGTRIPQDVAVVGVDDIGSANGWRGLLTSVDLDLDGMGRSAVARVLQAIDGDPLEPGVHHHPGRLIVGSSTMPKA